MICARARLADQAPTGVDDRVSGPRLRRARLEARRWAGFTLMELMMVMVLVAVLAALIVPEMKGTFGEEKLRAAGRQLIRACQLASSQSITVRQNHRLRVDSADHRYQVERLAQGEARGTGFAAIPDLPDSSGRLDDGIEVEIRPVNRSESLLPDPELPLAEADATEAGSVGDAILFYADGRSEAKELRLRDQHGFTLVVRVNPINGRLRIEKADASPTP